MRNLSDKNIRPFNKQFTVFAVLLVLLLLFSGCNSKTDTAESSSPDITSQPPETAFIDIAALTSDGQCAYKMIRGSVQTDQLKKAAVTFRIMFQDIIGVKPDMSEDWYQGWQKGDTVTNDELEILIGDTNRIESVNAKALLTDKMDYIIRFDGKKLVIIGGCDKATENALDRFAVLYLTNPSGKEIKLPADLSLKFEMFGADTLTWDIAKHYSIVYPTNASKKVVQSTQKVRTGITNTTKDLSSPPNPPKMVFDTGDDGIGKKEILVGLTNRAESISAFEGLAYYDYRIKVDGNKVIVIGGSPIATVSAAEKFAELYSNGAFSGDLPDGSDYTYRFSTEHFSPLAADFSSFVPNWSAEFKAPAWMLDFSEKTYSITNNNGRNMSIAHRGDWQHYPENSIASYVSAILAGADVIEIDVRETKDHVFVIMHDETLSRTTDYAGKNGKNGLPTSAKISEWTYQQLMMLNLKDKSGKVSEYKIPTLNEAIQVMSGRCFIMLDVKIEDLCDLNNDVYPIAFEYNAIPCFFYRYGLAQINQWTIKSKRPDDQEYLALCRKYLSTSGHLIRSRYWTIENNATSTKNETPAVWKKMYGEGKKLLWSNNILNYCKYIAENFTADIPKLP